MKEVQLKCYTGSFKKIPYKYYIQSPIGLVPKDNGQNVRLIFHLSYPKGGDTSVNANTPHDLCVVKYSDFDEAVERCIEEGFACSIAHSDMKAAFRNLCIRRKDWCLLIMKAKSPLDGQTYYFVDKCLPFGSSISCALFQAFSDAIAFLVKFRTGKKTVNYLDDYLFAALLKAFCDAQVSVFLQICQEIKFPVALEKTFWGSTQIVFLGLLIDMIRQMVFVPVEKIARAKELIALVYHKKKVTVHMLQQLCGFLNFLCRAVVPGRAFTRRLYMHYSHKSLKSHHHVRVTKDMKEDLKIWNVFLDHPNAYCRPFVDFRKHYTLTDIHMYSDATRNFKLGFGAICSKKFWMFGSWDEQFCHLKQPSIEYLELFAVAAAIMSWIHLFENKVIVLYCDNLSVVHWLRNSSASCPHSMGLI